MRLNKLDFLVHRNLVISNAFNVMNPKIIKKRLTAEIMDLVTTSLSLPFISDVS